MNRKESQLFPPPGQVYQVHSQSMHLYGAGTGNTTIVFVTGSGTPSAYTDYSYLQNELLHHARTVSYDHPGYGWSEGTAIPWKIDTIVVELHTLLEEANESAPYLLVGHSLASLEVIRFTQRYPDEVQAIVLLDGGSPEYYANVSEIKSVLINRLMAGLRSAGIVRALGTAGVLLPFSGENIRNRLLPEEMKTLDRSMYYRHLGEYGNLNFIQHMNENAQTVLRAGPLKDIPLWILSSDSGSDWQTVQQQLQHWSSLSTQETLPESQHYLHWSNQEAVLNKIVEALHSGSSEP